jgi:hypothetical protein
MDLDLGFVRIDDIGTLASWIGASISAAATGTTLWLRRRDRPEADFYFEQAAIEMGPRGRQLIYKSYNPSRDQDEVLSVTNVGDGSAYNVVVSSRGCRVRILINDPDDKRGLRTPIVNARVAPGDSFMLLIWNDFGVLPDEIVFRVEWLNSPTRHKRRMAMEFRRSDVLNEYPGESRYKKTDAD